MTADTPAPAMEPLSETELDRLEALAKAATRGPWHEGLDDEWNAEYDGSGSGECASTHLIAEGRAIALIVEGSAFGRDDILDANSAHIAAFDPPTALRLLAQARRAASGSLLGGERSERCPKSWAEWRDWLRNIVRKLEPLGHAQESIWLDAYAADLEKWSEAAAPPPPAAEPVAWTIRNVENGKLVLSRTSKRKEVADASAKALFDGKLTYEPVPLYTAPQPGGAEAKELRAKHDTQMRAVQIALSEAQRLIQVLPRDETRTALHELWSAVTDLAALAPPPGDAQEGGR